ncbi:cytochrome P450 71AU50-like [Cryptomeria japonica]|uniref:cytochrome P450 71AU50-like n=1 Tax=Cryptomeria japonica TaxID=3369 RepID=UPI0027DAAD89|nr:cytochrome P450 71AU50-like [Cryptomeria japonica]
MAEIGSVEIQVSRLHIKAIIMVSNCYGPSETTSSLELSNCGTIHFANTQLPNFCLDLTNKTSSILSQDMLIARVETSTTTLEWAMTELLRNPQAMSRAQEEIELKIGRDHIVRESDLVSLDYLRCLVKETLRLHAPAPLLMAHESTQGCNVGGYYIPPKTRFFVNVWAIGRDERVWEDPLEFKPKRFIGSSIDVNGHHFELFSFGTRRRGCPRIYMGFSSVYLVVAQLIHFFHWNVEGNLDREETFGLTLPKKFPISAFPSWKLTTDKPS